MKTKDWLAFLTLGTIWGSSFLWIKIAVQEISPLLLVALRLLFGLAGLLIIVILTRPDWPRNRRVWLALVIIGFTNNAIPYILISWGEQYIDSAIAAILNSTTPLFTMLIAQFFLRDDRITWFRIGGLLTGFLGIIIIVSRDLNFNQATPMHIANLIALSVVESPLNLTLLAQGAVLLASLFYAASSVFARRTTRNLTPVVQGFVPLIAADLALWLVAISDKNSFSVPESPITWIAVLWLGFFGTAVAFLLFYYLLHSVGPTRTTLVTYVFPLVGVVLGVIFLNERLDWHLILGGSLVVGSIVMVNRS